MPALPGSRQLQAEVALLTYAYQGYGLASASQAVGFHEAALVELRMPAVQHGRYGPGAAAPLRLFVVPEG